MAESIRTTDYHTAGEPFRIVVDGVPPLLGRTILDKRRWAAQHLDHVRRLLVNEPRGHADMYGCFVVDPAEGGDLGVIFFHNEGYSTACGHGTIALVTWALESGRLSAKSPVDGEVVVLVEAPSGRLRTWARVADGDVTSVRFRNVPSFVLRRTVDVEDVRVDIAFGGAFYAIVPAAVPIDREHLPHLIERGRRIKDALNHAGGVVHPLEPELRDVYGVVFFHNEGYSTACGHGTIALVTWAIETGRIRPEGPETRIMVDVPSGRLETWARIEGGRVRSVRFRNVPAFVHSAGVAFGGAFYASVEERVEPGELPRLIESGRRIKADLERERDIVHPLEPELRDIYGVVFWQEEDDGPPLVQRNVTVFADGEVDRSPCGSGTSARLALLAAEGRLGPGDELVHRSIVGSEFRARIVSETEVAGIPAVVTEVEGSAHLTGRHEFLLEPEDELGLGFLLR